MVAISIHKDVEHPDIASEYASKLKNLKNNGVLSPYIGCEGMWEGNKGLCKSFVYKIHIRLPDDGGWPKDWPKAKRKSNNYLVYARHWLDVERYEVISIMSPNAHEKAKTSFMAELERRAEEFQNS